MLEEAQGADVQGRSIMVDFVGDKSQKGARVGGKVLHVSEYLCITWYQYFYVIKNWTSIYSNGATG